jgi:hypothetical protein
MMRVMGELDVPGTRTRIGRFSIEHRRTNFADRGEHFRRGRTMSNTINTACKPVAMGVAAVIALSGAFTVGTTASVSAAPLSIGQTVVRDAVPDNVTNVHRRHRHYGGHAVAGLALGIIGAAIAHKAYKRYHRHHHYYGGGPYYSYGYYGAPSCIRRHGAWYCR